MIADRKAPIRVRRIERDPFDRQKRIAGWNQSGLTNASVLVIGAGALGNEVCKNLAQSGVGELIIADHDSIELTNLNRCIFYQPSDKGKLKADVLADRVHAGFPETRTEGRQVRCEDLDDDTYSNADMIVSCVDNIDARLTLNRYSSHFNLPLVDGGTGGLWGKVQTIVPPNTACLDCRWRGLGREIVQQRNRCGRSVEIFSPTEAAVSTTTSIVAAVQANEVIKLIHLIDQERLHGVTNSSFGLLTNKMWTFDLMSNGAAIVELEPDPNCPHHGDFASVLTLSDSTIN
jgi:molybdopterin/thiamine biosynthesis adenylyltransferase